ncbi:MAG: hypothetical protein AB1714_18395 [Acidobacteriota bacterium]
MAKVIASEVEIELSVGQVVDIVRQLKPEDQQEVRRALDATQDHPLDALLETVWARVEREPITEEEVCAEVERIRTSRHDSGRD